VNNAKEVRMSGGGIFLLVLFGVVAFAAISRIMSDRKQGKK
jgi:hypothetical protein